MYFTGIDICQLSHSSLVVDGEDTARRRAAPVGVFTNRQQFGMHLILPGLIFVSLINFRFRLI